MNLSEEAELCLRQVHGCVEHLHHEYVLPEHLLYVLADGEAIQDLFGLFEISAADVQRPLADFLRRKVEEIPGCEISFSDSVLRIFSTAHQQVTSSGRDRIELTDLFIALYSETNSYAVRLLNSLGLEETDMRAAVTDAVHPELRSGGEDDDSSSVKQGQSALELYAVNMTALAKEGGLDDVVGRTQELNAILRTLSRRKKNNPLLVGEPGVGKTAVVEGLAVRAAKGKLPEKFANLTIYALDMGALTAGTKFRGQFEERLKKVVRELGEKPEAVLFIDEIHTVVGAGATGSGSLDASNILKPSLNSGTLRCIGATTHEEYRNQVLKDKAFSRRFQKIDVPEPSPDETLQILSGIAPVYEKHHGVKFDRKALIRIVEIAGRHIFDRFMPDKAIDLLDEAGAANGMSAAPLKRITADYAENLAAEMFHLPKNRLTGDDVSRLQSLESELRRAVIGQDHAIAAVVQAVKLSRAGLADADKPVGSFLFAGPTGVGKTELSKRLASALGIELIRFDMSEYAEEYAVSKLIGSSPGYVGFEQGGLLTEQIIRHPHCVLLLDEMEKAHPKIYDLMLQIMDYGAMTDNAGRKADFRNVIVIMTSNVGAKSLSEHAIGFNAQDQTGSRADAAVRKHFSPEFRNRLDGIIHFHPLTPDSIRRIVCKFLEEASARLASRKLHLEADDKAIDWLVSHGFDEKLGARPLERLIRDGILAKLADRLLSGRPSRARTVRVTADATGLTVR